MLFNVSPGPWYLPFPRGVLAHEAPRVRGLPPVEVLEGEGGVDGAQGAPVSDVDAAVACADRNILVAR